MNGKVFKIPANVETLPPGTAITYAPHGMWDAPPLTIYVKGGNGAIQQVWDALKLAGHEMVSERP